MGAFDFGGDGADNAFAGILDPGNHAGMHLQHFAELGGDGDETLAQTGRRGLGDARVEALGLAAIKRGQLLDFRIVGLERRRCGPSSIRRYRFPGRRSAVRPARSAARCGACLAVFGQLFGRLLRRLALHHWTLAS